jgi:SAM-dependent methyltransferase
VRGALGRAVEIVVDLPAARRGRRMEREFDRTYRVNTAGIVRLENLAIAGANRDLGVRYQGSNPTWVRERIGRIPARLEDFVFVDIGSGKGRVLLVAAEFPFKRIVGVEFSRELHEVARQNFSTYRNPAQRCTTLESICMDASEFDFPIEPLVLYLYNPFLEPLLARVMDRVSASLTAAPRPAFLLYSGNASTKRLISAAGFRLVDPSRDDGLFEWDGPLNADQLS